VRIEGRLEEMINRGGKKLFPREIEEIARRCRWRRPSRS
jgi:acyl-CoA synthetase (AMP-forming)/AMP-acid ligase II